MFKIKVMAFVLFTMIFTSSGAYCQQDLQDHKVRTISGKIIGLDVEGWVIHLQTEIGSMDFYIGPESNLFRFTHHMAAIEMELKDIVTVQYVHSGGKNNIIKLVDHTPALH